MSISSIGNITLDSLEDPDIFGAGVQAAWYSGGEKSDSWYVPGDVDAMHIDAWFGLSLILNRGSENHDVNIRERTYGEIHLIYAWKRGPLEPARQLLELGAKANAASEQEKTPLMNTIEANHGEVVDLLLDRGELEIIAKNSRCSDRTALISAAPTCEIITVVAPPCLLLLGRRDPEYHYFIWPCDRDLDHDLTVILAGNSTHISRSADFKRDFRSSLIFLDLFLGLSYVFRFEHIGDLVAVWLLFW